ncbi:MAG: hypothetical protein ACI91Q_000452, partial [Gammaproteobacteria bacterium]
MTRKSGATEDFGDVDFKDGPVVAVFGLLIAGCVAVDAGLHVVGDQANRALKGQPAASIDLTHSGMLALRFHSP